MLCTVCKQGSDRLKAEWQELRDYYEDVEQAEAACGRRRPTRTARRTKAADGVVLPAVYCPRWLPAGVYGSNSRFSMVLHRLNSVFRLFGTVTDHLRSRQKLLESSVPRVDEPAATN